MKFYYNIIFKGGNELSGHNCTNILIQEDGIILRGFDEFNFVSGYQKHDWCFKYDFDEIKGFNFEIMQDEDE